MNDPQALVESFIADYFRWNEAAMQRRDRAGDSDDGFFAAMETAKQEYAALIERYCRPGFEPQPVSFGTPPKHDLACESILSVTPKGATCRIKTKMVDPPRMGGMTSDYVYQLAEEGDRWYLESVKVRSGSRGVETL
jgi:hypothetical protein